MGSNKNKNNGEKKILFRQQLYRLLQSSVSNGVAVNYIIAELANAEFDLRITLKIQAQQLALEQSKQSN